MPSSNDKKPLETSTTPEATPEGGAAANKTESVADRQAQEHQGDMPHGKCEDSSQSEGGSKKVSEEDDGSKPPRGGKAKRNATRVEKGKDDKKRATREAEDRQTVVKQLLKTQKKHCHAFVGFGRRSVAEAMASGENGTKLKEAAGRKFVQVLEDAGLPIRTIQSHMFAWKNRDLLEGEEYETFEDVLRIIDRKLGKRGKNGTAPKRVSVPAEAVDLIKGIHQRLREFTESGSGAIHVDWLAELCAELDRAVKLFPQPKAANTGTQGKAPEVSDVYEKAAQEAQAQEDSSDEKVGASAAAKRSVS